MTTFEDIQFDTCYSHPTFRFLLLKNELSNQIGPSPVIVAPNASLMTFIQVFNELIQCQQFINNAKQKLITLFISNEKIIDWNNQINIIDNNIDKIYIYCDTYFDYLKMKRWKGCYQYKIQGVYRQDQVDLNLIKLGIDYIYSIMGEYQDDRGLRRKFCTDARKLTQALMDYFQKQMDDLDESPSEESQ